MARSIEHRSTYSADAATVHATVVDADFLRAKLASLGGPRAELLEHSDDGARVTFRTRHGIPADQLPGPVRTLLGGDLTIDRTETWEGGEGGAFTGDIRVTVPNAPGELTGTSRITGGGAGSGGSASSGGCEQAMRGQIRVSVPVVGGKIEESVGGHITSLLDAEAEFTERWLRANR